ncbi:MAG TPA: multidrug effflux MFS transporter [Hyphomicrobiales bacterium]|nr:multidrug effflux MFS transporter [Hyphomicrobiales bacterium]
MSAAPTPLMGRGRTIALGGVLLALGSISLSIYTPAMPVLVQAFGTTIGSVKATMTFYFAGFALAQLVAGPLSDAYGRRPATFGFLGLYLVASVVAAFAPSIHWLVVARLLQGIGASAGVAMSRAMVRDQYTGAASNHIMNMIGLVLGIGPAMAPTIGGLTLKAFGWQAIFILLIVYGAACIALVATMPETLAARDPSRFHPARLVRTYGAIATDTRFLQPGLTVATTTGCLYTLSTLLPFAMIDRVGLSPWQFGLAMIIQSGSYVAGAAILRQLLRRFTAEAVLPYGIGLILVAGILLAVGLRTLPPSVLTVMGPVAVLAVGVAFTQPAVTTAALAHFPTAAGAAAALFGAMQIGGGLAGALVGLLMSDQVIALATVIPGMAVLAIAAHFSLGRVNRIRAAEAVAAPAAE